MQWFEATAPIRLKMLVAFASMVGLMVLNALVSLFGPGWVTLAIQASVIAIAITLAARFRRAVCEPYVNTVVRMEGLAAGDLSSPIAYNDYKDCVGRMTNAMQTFRNTAVEQQKQAAEQAEVVGLFGRHLAQLTAGNLTAPIEEELPPGYAELKSDFNAALESLRGLIGSVAASADAIRTGSGEIAQASEDLARRTEANAASLEQTSAAVTQMDGRLKATAEAAGRTVVRADGAISTVEEGRSIAEEAVQAMARVADGAEGIDSVIEGLDKIAFQTRVLAMNAAVEAGRAGEAGRGFAVVADLVSALAMRSEEEAARARNQLTATQSDIVAAVDMVHRVDGALANIAGGVAEVHSLLGQMASDNQAQSVAISEISVAIGSMDQSTQQNAAMVEETSAAARNLSGEVSVLADQAAKFTIDTTARKARRQSAPILERASGSGYKSPIKPLPALSTSHAPTGEWAGF
jgi:methyl-accepting chemotaxis protein